MSKEDSGPNSPRHILGDDGRPDKSLNQGNGSNGSYLCTRTTVALWLPTVDHWLHPEQAWSVEANLISEPLRDLMAYELVDDRMIRDGALDSLGVRHLIEVDGKLLKSVTAPGVPYLPR